MTSQGGVRSRLDDWLNPIVVKELRQAVHGKFVAAALLLLLIVQLAALGIYIVSNGDFTGRFDAGRNAFMFLLAILMAIPWSAPASRVLPVQRRRERRRVGRANEPAYILDGQLPGGEFGDSQCRRRLDQGEPGLGWGSRALWTRVFDDRVLLARRYLLARWMGTKYTWFVALLLLAAGCIIPFLIGYLVAFGSFNRAEDIGGWLVTNPFTLGIDSYQSTYLVFAGGWALLASVLNADWFIEQIHAFRPPEVLVPARDGSSEFKL